MQLVINIPEEIYQKIKETSMFISGRRNGKRIDYILFNAVNTGIPLPKGHGDLIDKDAFQKYCFNKNFDKRLSEEGLAIINMFLEFQDTIIKADKEERSGKG